MNSLTNSDLKESVWVKSLGILLIVRVGIDGFLNFRLVGLQATQVFGATFAVIGFFYIFAQQFRMLLNSVLIFNLLLASTYFGSLYWGRLGFDEFVRTLSVFGVFLLASRATSYLSLLKFFLCVRLSSVLCALVAIIQFATSSNGVFVSGVWRYPGFFYGSNVAAILYVISIVSEVTILKNTRRITGRASIVISSIGLILTFSLSGFILLPLVLFLKRAFERWHGERGKVIVSLFSSLFFTAALYASLSDLRVKVNRSIVPVYQGNATGESSLQWRLNAWSRLIEFFNDKPILGQGFGSTRNLNMAGSFLPHNEYLRSLIEVGLLGTIILTVLYVIVIRNLAIAYLKLNHEFLLFMLVMTLALCINAFSENTFTYTVPQMIIATGLGFYKSKVWEMRL